MTALPPLTNTRLDPIMANVVSAYNVCLKFQAAARDDPNALLHARVLGYLILHTTARALALDEVVKAIHSCGEDYYKLSQLGESFINYFIAPFKAPLMDADETDLLEASQNHMEAKSQALIRDGFRCVVTGVYDDEAPTELGLTDEEVLAHGSTVHTQCAYILMPESMYFGVQNVKDSDKDDYAASVLAVVQRFGCDPKKINVHSLFNVMTMEANRREWFNRLEMWFEKLGENRYKVCSSQRRYWIPYPEITFTTPDPERLPVPSEDLLELHAVCCKVAHLSGARQYIENARRDAEELDVLAEEVQRLCKAIHC